MEELSRTALNRRISSLEEALARLESEKEDLRHQLNMEIKTLRRAAYKDTLTGLHNRRFLEERTKGRGGWHVLADLDGFKQAQDAHPRGHAYGDDILVEFAEFLLTEIRTGPGRNQDRVAVRLGGDEFAIWCPSKAGAERIRNVVRAWSSSDGAVGASAGMGRDIESADASLYFNKQARKAA